MVELLFVVLWVACGVISYGMTFAYFQREFPTLAEEHYRKHVGSALSSVFFGLIGILAIVACGWRWRKHGLKWR